MSKRMTTSRCRELPAEFLSTVHDAIKDDGKKGMRAFRHVLAIWGETHGELKAERERCRGHQKQIREMKEAL